ncbi:DUF302 domain-containing protein [Saccharicrinis fermentans]|uniref:DUF302 domain-containing protein n=1 Tax=Saccharicrinis fermentans DSM 9555 = JCM 21142 TaxID=869213 RepID=W7Y1D3_9BACT|nr:DUF302 domain-containing protein [Saccharicrinis fermentans]GAF01772.1 hypothetical protein JCM21142_388 [Saccharicrinis fermentans DSM 9555 = JCM 21142]
MKIILGFIFYMMFALTINAQDSYYFNKMVELSFEEATTKAKASLKTQGFGIVAESNMDKMLKEKIGVDLMPYRVLGACNPKIAYRAIQVEDNIAIFLPCKVIIKYVAENKTEVVMVNPVVAMKAIDNTKAHKLLMEVSVLMKKALDDI